MSHTGAVRTADPRAAAQAAAVGATIDPKTGWWFKDGKQLSHDEADALVNAAGIGVAGQQDFGSGRGTLGEMYDRNQKWLDPVAVGVTSLINPALGAATSAGLSYGKNHDLGKAALDAGLTYGGGKLLSGAGKALGKIPGVQSAGNAIKNSAVGQAVSNVGDAFKPVVAGAQQVGKASGLTIPTLADLGGKVGDAASWLTGNNGMNALGVAQGLNAADLMRQSTGFATQAKDIGMQNWNARAPLREKGLAGLTKPAPIDLSQLQAQSRVGNPFALSPVGGR